MTRCGPRYGYRRVTAELRRRGLPVKHKRVQRLMQLMNLQRKIKAKKRRTTNSQHAFPRYPNLVQDLVVIRSDQVWVYDITYIALRQECVYLAAIMAVYTRGICGWQLSRSLDYTLTLGALRRALPTQQSEIHHSDQGVQYAATAYTAEWQARRIQISMAEVGEPTQKGYAERLMRTIKEEEVDLSDYDDYHDALTQLGKFLDDVYMHKRVHSSLGYLTPVEFEAQWRVSQADTLIIP